MTKMTFSAGFHEVQRSIISRDNEDERKCYMGMHGRVSVASLLAHLATIEPDLKPEQMMLNFATVTWTSPATEEERAARAEQRRRADERTEAWERETLVRLKKKYEVP